MIYQEPTESMEHISDQSALPNLNADWVNAKGESNFVFGFSSPHLIAAGFKLEWQIYVMESLSPMTFVSWNLHRTSLRSKRLIIPNFSQGAWTIHIVLIAVLKILFNIIPGVSQQTSWTLTNISYMFGSYLMFHYVRGVPFEFNAGAYDNLNMWEQIDNGDQYTPSKKFLLSVPIVLFLLSTHYTQYDLTYFTINFLAVLGVVIPKLPSVCLSSSRIKKFANIKSRVIGCELVCFREVRMIDSTKRALFHLAYSMFSECKGGKVL